MLAAHSHGPAHTLLVKNGRQGRNDDKGHQNMPRQGEEGHPARVRGVHLHVEGVARIVAADAAGSQPRRRAEGGGRRRSGANGPGGRDAGPGNDLHGGRGLLALGHLLALGQLGRQQVRQGLHLERVDGPPTHLHPLDESRQIEPTLPVDALQRGKVQQGAPIIDGEVGELLEPLDDGLRVALGQFGEEIVLRRGVGRFHVGNPFELLQTEVLQPIGQCPGEEASALHAKHPATYGRVGCRQRRREWLLRLQDTQHSAERRRCRQRHHTAASSRSSSAITIPSEG
mmetsp:Transcript_3151/g.9051  ORF Transcript_3151/g.9051 Transcript_3151/m.9051 type:complete len:285 (+) Transcript_3151:1529-2383(+)